MNLTIKKYWLYFASLIGFVFWQPINSYGQINSSTHAQDPSAFIERTAPRTSIDESLLYYMKENINNDLRIAHPNAFIAAYPDLFFLGKHGKLVFRDSAIYRKSMTYNQNHVADQHKNYFRHKYDGFYSYHYFYKGIKVENKGVRFNIRAGQIAMIAVSMTNSMKFDDKDSLISPEEAKNKVMQAKKDKYLKLHINTINLVYTKLDDSVYVSGNDIYKADDSVYKRYYKLFASCLLNNGQYKDTRLFYVDAQTGAILRDHSIKLH